MSATFSLRPATQADGAFLGDMVAGTVNWRPGAEQPKVQLLTTSEHTRYIAGWKRPADRGFIAQDDVGKPIGAAWYRLLPKAEPGFGYVGTGVPELIIGVRPIWRAHGVGRALLRGLSEQARADGYARLSLSVERGNFASILYRSEGFAVTVSTPARDTMVKNLR